MHTDIPTPPRHENVPTLTEEEDVTAFHIEKISRQSVKDAVKLSRWSC